MLTWDRQDKALKVWNNTLVGYEAAIYAVYEAGLAEGAAPETPAAARAQDELVRIAIAAYLGDGVTYSDWEIEHMTAVLAAVRPKIEAAARESLMKDVEKDITAYLLDEHGWNIGDAIFAASKIRARLTPTPEPVERVTIKPYPGKDGNDFAVWLDDKSIFAANKREWCEGYAVRVRAELAAEREEQP